MAEHAHSPVASLGLPSHDTLLVDDDTLFGKMAASFLSSPAPPLEEHAPAAPVGDGNATVPPLPLPLAVDDEDIFGGLDVDDDLLDFEPTDTTPGAAFVDHAVWAKLRGYPAWPAQVLSPHVGHQAPPQPRPSCVLVHFFGTYDIQWVESEKKISPFERDFNVYATKDKSKAFQRAVREAQHFVATGGPRLGQLPPEMMSLVSGDEDMMHQRPEGWGSANGGGGAADFGAGASNHKSKNKRSANDLTAGMRGNGVGREAAGVALLKPLPPLPPPADGIPRRIKVARRLGLLPPAHEPGGMTAAR